MSQQQLEKEVKQMVTQDKYTTVKEKRVKEKRVKEAIHDHGNYIKKLNSCVERGVWGK